MESHSSRARASALKRSLGSKAVNIAEVNEKFDETSEPIKRLRHARNVKSAKKDFSAFSYPASSVHSYIEESIADFPNPIKGASPSQDLVWYQRANGTPLMRLFRKLRNVNAHVKTIAYANRHTIALEATASIKVAFTATVRRAHPTLRQSAIDTIRHALDHLRFLSLSAQQAMRGLLACQVPNQSESPANWNAMFDSSAIGQGLKKRHELLADEIALCQNYSVVELCDQYVVALKDLISDAVERNLLYP